MAPDARYAADAAILKNLESLPEFAEAPVIAAYASDGTEPDLMPLLKRAAGTGKTICLPRWLNDSNGCARRRFQNGQRQMEHAGTASRCTAG